MTTAGEALLVGDVAELFVRRVGIAGGELDPRATDDRGLELRCELLGRLEVGARTFDVAGGELRFTADRERVGLLRDVEDLSAAPRAHRRRAPVRGIDARERDPQARALPERGQPVGRAAEACESWPVRNRVSTACSVNRWSSMREHAAHGGP